MANKTFDSLGLIVEDEAVTTTASCTPVNIVGLNIGSTNYVAVFNIGSITGTPSGTDYHTLQLKACATVGGTYVVIGEPIVVSVDEQAQIGFTSEQIERAATGAEFFEVTATKVNTAATGVTYTAFISKV